MGMKTIGRFTYDNATVSAVAAGEAIPVPNITVSTGCISCDGKNITINKPGVYEILCNFTFTATATGPIETQMYRGGNPIPGAHAVDTATTIGNYTSQAFHAVVTVPCNAPQAIINVKANYDTSVRVANIIVIKVA
ncbi:MAG TPA: hypothetical protein DCW90_12015 [Lachnospiraceae bacterium]|nr:hypothetical protein [Lachnospiraceae bacterium]